MKADGEVPAHDGNVANGFAQSWSAALKDLPDLGKLKLALIISNELLDDFARTMEATSEFIKALANATPWILGIGDSDVTIELDNKHIHILMGCGRGVRVHLEDDEEFTIVDVVGKVPALRDFMEALQKRIVSCTFGILGDNVGSIQEFTVKFVRAAQAAESTEAEMTPNQKKKAEEDKAAGKRRRTRRSDPPCDVQSFFDLAAAQGTLKPGTLPVAKEIIESSQTIVSNFMTHWSADDGAKFEPFGVEVGGLDPCLVALAPVYFSLARRVGSLEYNSSGTFTSAETEAAEKLATAIANCGGDLKAARKMRAHHPHPKFLEQFENRALELVSAIAKKICSFYLEGMASLKGSSQANAAHKVFRDIDAAIEDPEFPKQTETLKALILEPAADVGYQFMKQFLKAKPSKSKVHEILEGLFADVEEQDADMEAQLKAMATFDFAGNMQAAGKSIANLTAISAALTSLEPGETRTALVTKAARGVEKNKEIMSLDPKVSMWLTKLGAKPAQQGR